MRKQPPTLRRRVFIRLLIITMAVVLLFYSIGLYLNSVGIANVRSDLQSANDAETRYIASQIQREVVNLTAFTQELGSDKALLRYSIGSGTMSDYQRIENVKMLSDKLLRIKRFSDLVESARIYLPQIKRVIVTDRIIYNDMEENEWARVNEIMAGRLQAMQEIDGDMNLLVAKYQRRNPMFVLQVSLSSRRLLEQVRQMASDANAELMLTRADGSQLVGTEEAAHLRAIWETQDGHSAREKFVGSSAYIQSLDLTLWCFSPSEAAMQPILRHRLWIWGLTLLAAGLLGAYLLYYRFSILRPINTLFESVHRAAETGEFHIDESDADFDDVYAQFNNMVARIESLAGQVYEERFRAQQAELRQLQMQINPHFFYNTLFMVYRMAQAEGSDTIAQISLNLSNYYRYITKLPEHDVPLRDEVKHIGNYLEIQGIRFAPRVAVHMDELPDEIADERIPPLILQPIVENAFVHGVKNKTSGGLVQVSFQMDEQRFGVSVHDNGGAMDEANVRELDKRMRAGELPEGSALYNLYRRMELSYGPKYELRMESVDQGLTISILFPRTKE